MQSLPVLETNPDNAHLPPLMRIPFPIYQDKRCRSARPPTKPKDRREKELISYLDIIYKQFSELEPKSPHRHFSFVSKKTKKD